MLRKLVLLTALAAIVIGSLTVALAAPPFTKPTPRCRPHIDIFDPLPCGPCEEQVFVCGFGGNLPERACRPIPGCRARFGPGGPNNGGESSMDNPPSTRTYPVPASRFDRR